MADFESQNGTTPAAVLSSSTENNVTAKVVNENVAELSFGKEFEDVEIVSNARVSVYLQHTAADAARNDEELNDVYRKSMKYVDRFNAMKDPENNDTELVHELENLQEALIKFRQETDDGMDLKLHGCEAAALMNLVATDTGVDEAKALIPSLGKFRDSAIDEILDSIKTTMIRIIS
mmetsp:Transcript_33516/g.40155  ORF Transcript_33516/g.40155 Transcript_33516/m.40155 type:complete len:177 (+) Transcript_33516:86-616(+)